jgi:hypothetical protein
LASTLVFLLGTGLVLRPDRDAAQYLRHQHVESAESDLQSRQLFTQIRHLRREGLALDQIKGRVLSSTAFTHEIVDRMIEFETALRAKEQAEDQLTLFAAIALAPPLLILELGAALLWALRSYRAWTNALPMDLRATVLYISNLLRRLFRQALPKQI